MPKPTLQTYNIRRAVSNDYYWSNSTWETNVAQSTPLRIPPYSDTGTEPWNRTEYNVFTITYQNLVEWYKLMETISVCY
jgi:hypothetical protein